MALAGWATAQVTPFVPNDPYFGPDLAADYSGQWYLRNQAPANMTLYYTFMGSTIPNPAVNTGLDANVTPAWQRGITGRNVVIGIVGITGFQADHPDLAPGYRADLSRQFSQDPAIASQPQGPLSADDNHDTAVAGVAAARGGNGLGMAGAAPLAGLAGFRVDNPDNTINAAANQNWVDANYFASGVTSAGAITGYADVAVRNRSYARSTPFALEDPRVIQSLDATANNNVVNVFASGNFRGSPMGDSGRMQGNSLASAIAVAALGSDGKFADYSNHGASIFVTAPGARLDGTGLLSPTTDRTGALGYTPGGVIGDLFPDPAYTSIFNGTSATAPVITGIVALGKEINPFLDVRLAKHALAATSRVVDATDASATGGWQTNGAGLPFNPNYGFGLVDAGAFVNRVEQAAFVTAPQSAATGTLTPAAANQVLTAGGRTESLALGSLFGASPLPVEAVEITLDVASANRTALQGRLTSPAGTTSTFMTATHLLTGYAPIFDDPTPAAGLQWTFVANNFWGETPTGTWQLSLSDLAGNSSTWNSYALKFHLGRMVLESGNVAITTATTAHSAVLDLATTAMSIASGATFSVRDEFVLNNGALRVDGRLQNLATAGTARSLLRLNAGRLTGTGTIATSLGVLNTAGTVRPGDTAAIGTLTIEGAYTQAAGGILEIDLGANTSADTLVIRGGTVALGGTLRVNLPTPAQVVAGTIPIIRAENGGSITGTFATVELPRVSPTLMLRVAPASSATFALEAYRNYLVADVTSRLTAPQLELAAYLATAATRTGAPYEGVLRAIDRQATLADAATAIGAVGPFSPSVAATVALASDSSRLDTVLGHSRSGTQPGLFVETSYADADLDATVRRPGYDHTDRGLVAGYGFAPTAAFSGGLFLGVSDSRARLDLAQGALDGDHRAVGLHATWSSPALRVTAAVQHGWGKAARTRVVSFPGTSEQVGSHSGLRQWSAVLEAAHTFTAGALTHQVFGNLRLQDARIAGYTEPGAYSWTVDRQDARSTLGRIGYELSRSIELEQSTLQPFVSLAYSHEFVGDDHALTARLTGDTTGSLRVHAERTGRNYATLRAGAVLRFKGGFQLYGLGHADLGRSDASRLSLHLGLRRQF